MTRARVLRGACHCGAVRVALRTAKDLAPRACQCAFCRKHGARTVSDPDGRARVVVRDAAALRRYRFARRSADFLVCGACGVYVGPMLERGGRAWMTVNANALDDGATGSLGAPGAPVRYDDETDEERVARRMASWTPADLLTIARVRSDEPTAAALLGEYVAGLRAMIPEFDPSRGVTADPDELVAPHGAFLVVSEGDRALACGGVKTHAPGVGEVKRMYVRPEARRRGVARDLLEALEDEARALGMTTAVLDTRVPEASAAVELYRATGYVDVPPYNENPFANVWMRKPLA